MRATIVIPSLNEGDNLWKTVGSCLETTAGLECELLVADDASQDGSPGEVRRRFPSVRIVAHDRRRGVAPTKDLGARHAAGDVLVFIDGHCKPEPAAIARLVADVEELNGRAIVTPAVPALNTDAWTNEFNQVGHGYWMELEQFTSRWSDTATLRRRGRLLESPALVGCCVAVARTLYDQLLGFDAGMLEWGAEDLDFGLKAWLMGASVLNDPDAVIGHRFRASFDNFDVSAVQPLVNQLRMAFKNFDDPVWAEWVSGCRRRHEPWPDLWQQVWKSFEDGRESLERERAYLHERRTRDEYWFAEYFDLPWPRQTSGLRSG
ncbi:MAG TPA: glycosyltransferase [Vicinamibacterales bacterium]|nr:glycosyltransferase [Vicinamibacterales bacterium]